MLKKVVNEHNLTPMLANGVSMMLGGILALGHSYLAGENWAPLPVNNLKMFASYSLAMCLISNIVCYNLYGYLLKRFSATFMSFSGLVTPLFASLFGYLFLQEHIDKNYFISVGLFAIGLAVFYFEEIKKNKKEAQESKEAIAKDNVQVTN